MPDITVSIVNWNTADELRDCLDSVLLQQQVSFEITVIDNASSDNSVEMLQSSYTSMLTLITNSKNVGFGRAHNQALNLSQSRYFMILNPDCKLPDSNTLSHIVDYMDSNTEIGILGPKILNSDGTLQFSARRFPSMIAGMFRNTLLDKLFPSNKFVSNYLMSDWSHDEISEVDWLSGAAMVVRKNMVDQIGALDERFFMYCEDIDWCKRAHDAEWRVVYYPIVSVLHRIGAASDKDPYNAIRRHHKSMLQYFLKYNSNKPAVLLTPVVMLGLWLRARSVMRKIKPPHPQNPSGK
jgi:GT2 family glycosyltransferase